MAEYTLECNQCGATYIVDSTDINSEWTGLGIAPCPNVTCRGELFERK